MKYFGGSLRDPTLKEGSRKANIEGGKKEWSSVFGRWVYTPMHTMNTCYNCYVYNFKVISFNQKI